MQSTANVDTQEKRPMMKIADTNHKVEIFIALFLSISGVLTLGGISWILLIANM